MIEDAIAEGGVEWFGAEQERVYMSELRGMGFNPDCW